MDHAEATAAHATDRYLLGELNAAEADAFEEHFFDCVACSDELRVGMRFLNGGRGLAREAAAPLPDPRSAPGSVVPIEDRRARRTGWLPAAVAAALVLSIATPLLLRERSSAPSFEVASQHSFLLAESRGTNDVPTVNGNAPIVLWADVPPEPRYARYEAKLHAPDGSTQSLEFTPDPNGEATPLTVRGLSAGSHELAIVGITSAGHSAEIARHRFIVRR